MKNLCKNTEEAAEDSKERWKKKNGRKKNKTQNDNKKKHKNKYEEPEEEEKTERQKREESTKMMDSVYPEPLSRLHRRAVRKKFHKNSARYRTQPVTFAEIQEVDEDQVTDDPQSTGSTSKSELDLKAKFEEFKRQRDKDLLEIRLTANGVDTETKDGSHATISKEDGREGRSLLANSPSILPYRGSSSCPRTSA